MSVGATVTGFTCRIHHSQDGAAGRDIAAGDVLQRTLVVIKVCHRGYAAGT
jgi:hypothetical protein